MIRTTHLGLLGVWNLSAVCRSKKMLHGGQVHKPGNPQCKKASSEPHTTDHFHNGIQSVNVHNFKSQNLVKALSLQTF